MSILETLKQAIDKIGIKEVSRRSGLSASTISRIGSGQITPGLEAAEKISTAVGYRLDLLPVDAKHTRSRLMKVLATLRELRPQLIKRGVRHITVFGSVARQEDRADSDIDLYIDYGGIPTGARLVLGVEGSILEAFPNTKIDFVSNLTTPKGLRLKIQIEKDGVRVF